jgi:hypothetical protein
MGTGFRRFNTLSKKKGNGYMTELMNKLKETTAFIRNKWNGKPVAGIVLGSGLGNLIHEIKVDIEIGYDEIPHFPVSTVEGHHGKLILGTLSGKNYCGHGRPLPLLRGLYGE